MCKVTQFTDSFPQKMRDGTRVQVSQAASQCRHGPFPLTALSWDWSWLW